MRCRNEKAVIHIYEPYASIMPFASMLLTSYHAQFWRVVQQLVLMRCRTQRLRLANMHIVTAGHAAAPHHTAVPWTGLSLIQLPLSRCADMGTGCTQGA